jgi:hypothetical protein
MASLRSSIGGNGLRRHRRTDIDDDLAASANLDLHDL